MQGCALAGAYQVLSKDQIELLLDIVRNRLLAFMLDLEDQFPDLAQSEAAVEDIPKDLVANIFHTFV